MNLCFYGNCHRLNGRGVAMTRERGRVHMCAVVMARGRRGQRCSLTLMEQQEVFPVS